MIYNRKKDTQISKKQEKKAEKKVFIRLTIGKSKKIKIGKKYPKVRKYGAFPWRGYGCRIQNEILCVA